MSELIRIVLLIIAFMGIILLVKIIRIDHKDRQQQIKAVIQKIRSRGVRRKKQMLEPGAINRQFERDVEDFNKWPEWMKKLSCQKEEE